MVRLRFGNRDYSYGETLFEPFHLDHFIIKPSTDLLISRLAEISYQGLEVQVILGINLHHTRNVRRKERSDKRTYEAGNDVKYARGKESG